MVSSSMYSCASFLLLTIHATATSDRHNTSHLKFFLYIQLNGPNATGTVVATAGPNKTSFSFGSLTVADESMSLTIDTNQGIAVQVQESPPVTSVVQNFVFTSCDFNGIVLALIGQLTPLLPTWELAVVGGSGQFRMARGYAIGIFALLNNTAGTIIVQYDVYVTTKN